MLLKVIGIICDNRGISIGFKGFDLEVDPTNLNGNTRYFYDIPANKVGNYKYENIKITNNGIDFLDGSPSDLPVYDMSGKRVQNKNSCILLYKVLYNGVENSFIALRADDKVVRVSRPELLNIIQKVPFYNVECSDSRIRARKGSILERNFVVPTKKPVLSNAKSPLNPNNVFKSDVKPSVTSKPSLGTDNIFISDEKPNANEKAALSPDNIFKSDVKPEVNEKAALSTDDIFKSDVKPEVEEKQGALSADSVFTEPAMSESLDADSVFADVDTFESGSEYPKRIHFDTITTNEAVTSNVQLFGYDTDIKYYPIMQDINSSEAAFTNYKGKDLCLNKSIFEYKDIHAKADRFSLKDGKYILVSYTYDPLSKGESSIKNIKLVDKSGNALILNTKSELRKIEEQGQLRNAKVIAEGTGIECDSVLATVNYENCSTFPLVHDAFGNIAFLTKDLNPQADLYVPMSYLLAMTDDDLTYIGQYFINRFFTNYIASYCKDIEMPTFKWHWFEDTEWDITNYVMFDRESHIIYVPRIIRNDTKSTYLSPSSFYMLLIFAIGQYLLKNTNEFQKPSYYSIKGTDKYYIKPSTYGRNAIKSISFCCSSALISVGYSGVNAFEIEQDFSKLNTYGKDNCGYQSSLYLKSHLSVNFLGRLSFNVLDLNKFHKDYNNSSFDRLKKRLSNKDNPEAFSSLWCISNPLYFNTTPYMDYSLFLTGAFSKLKSSVASVKGQDGLVILRSNLTKDLIDKHPIIDKGNDCLGVDEEGLSKEILKAIPIVIENSIEGYEELRDYFKSVSIDEDIDLNNLPMDCCDEDVYEDSPYYDYDIYSNYAFLYNYLGDTKGEKLLRRKMLYYSIAGKKKKGKVAETVYYVLRTHLEEYIYDIFGFDYSIENLKGCSTEEFETIKSKAYDILYKAYEEYVDFYKDKQYSRESIRARKNYCAENLNGLKFGGNVIFSDVIKEFDGTDEENLADFTDAMYKLNLLTSLEVAINILESEPNNTNKVSMLKNLLKFISISNIKTTDLAGRGCEFIYSLLMITAMTLEWGKDTVVGNMTLPFDKTILQIMLKPSYDNLIMLSNRLYPYLGSVYRKVVF